MSEKLVLGSAQFGLVYGRTNTTGLLPVEKVAEIVKIAADNGVKYIDTARAYGVAEERFGKIFSDDSSLNRSINIVTKLGTFDSVDLDPIFQMNNSVINAMVDGSVFRSCRELKRHSLHTLCLHRCSQLNTPIWDRLIQLRDEGVIERLGVSVQSVEECTSALNNADVKHIQLPLNLIDWRWRTQEFLDLCKLRTDVIFQCRGSLLQGILVNNAEFWPEIEGIDASEIVKKLDGFVKKFQFNSKLSLCFGFVLSLPFVNGIVLGIDNLDQLQENLKIFQTAELTLQQRKEIEAAFSSENIPVQLLNPALWPKK
jgi:aryl-alcohol dehydrogenase-like predicted oxidoreductase